MDFKKMKILIILGIVILIIAAPISGLLMKINIINEKDLIVKDGTNYSNGNNMTLAYTQEFTLKQDQVAYIEISCFYINSSITLMILGQGDYERYLNLETTWNSISGGDQRYFVYQVPDYSPSVYDGTVTNELSIDQNTYDIYFKGGGSTSLPTWSVPGDYVMVIFGHNAGPAPGLENVEFNVKLSKTGPNDIVNDILLLIGWLLIIGSIGLFVNGKYNFIGKDNVTDGDKKPKKNKKSKKNTEVEM